MNEVKHIQLTPDEVNELNNRLEQSRYQKLLSVINDKQKYYYKTRYLGIKPDTEKLDTLKELDEIKLPSSLEINKDQMYNVYITIDPSYFLKGKGWYPVNTIIDLFNKAKIKYYRKHISHNFYKNKDKLFKMITFSHLYKIKNNSQYNYLKKFFPDELEKYYNPHLHIMCKIPPNKINEFYNSIKRYIKKKCHSASISMRAIRQTTEDQVRCMKYGYKFESLFCIE